MHPTGVIFCFLAILPASPLLADAADGDPRLSQLFRTFVAPCCWRENLLTHQSPQADALRADIRRRIAAGQSDAEISASLVSQYSGRLLATPAGPTGLWLTWTPVVTAIAGLAALALILARLRARPASQITASALPIPPEAEWDLWDGPPPPTRTREDRRDA